MKSKISIPIKNLNSFCRKHQIRELSLFGSAVRNGLRPGSDVDILVSFLPQANPTFVELDELRSSLEKIFGRKVDLVEAEAIQNPFRRYSIFKNRKKLYAA